MSPTAIALLGYVLWTMILLAGLGITRSGLVLAGKRAANSFNPSGDDMDGFGRRLTRAHANCYENLPIAGAVLLFAIASGQEAVTNGLATALLGARIGQSMVHLVSTSSAFVLIRFAFFGAQLLILTYWLVVFFGLI